MNHKEWCPLNENYQGGWGASVPRQCTCSMNEKPCEKCTHPSKRFCLRYECAEGGSDVCPCHTPAPQEEKVELFDMTDSTTGEKTAALFLSKNCECQFLEPYGFVPEAGCKEHDTVQFSAFTTLLIERVRREDTLSELIEKCGDSFVGVGRSGDSDLPWLVQYTKDNEDILRGWHGSTPKEAVRNLLSHLDSKE